jgi:serine/threonine-protein kinase
VLGHLGAGGMGVVLSGEHVFLARPVAIKLMRDSIAQSSVMVRRFLAEARAASRIVHPNVVEVTDYGVLADGRPYLVMEWVGGQPLDRMLADRGALPPGPAMRVARAVAEGLVAAHARGVVHNDLKPANIVLLEGSSDQHPALKIVDFGAASFPSGAASVELDEHIGTPAYMSPEQVRGEPTDGRSDVYALGAVLYEMLTGAPPFAGNIRSVLRAHLTSEPAPPSSPFGAMPSPVTRVVVRALAKRLEQRPQSAVEFMLDLDRALSVLERPSWRKWLPA